MAVRAEQRFPGQSAVLEAAAEAWDFGAFGVGVAGADAADSFGGDVLGDAFVHFHQNETAVAAVFGVLFQDGVGGGAGAGEAIEIFGFAPALSLASRQEANIRATQSRE